VNPLLFIVALAIAGFSWSLLKQLRAGEFRFGNGSYGRTNARVRRETDPAIFWILVAIQTGVILYIASIGIEIWRTPLS
jgi:hypothetical protein